MEVYGYGSDHGPYETDRRRIEIVSGKGYGFNQNYYASRTESSGEVTRASHDGATPVPKPWSFCDAHTKRRKRIARYKVYAVEGKVKATLRNGIRWIKHTCSRIVHGY